MQGALEVGLCMSMRAVRPHSCSWSPREAKGMWQGADKVSDTHTLSFNPRSCPVEEDLLSKNRS